MKITDDIKKLKGIGEKKAADFARLGILTIEDLVNYFPRSYEVYEAPVTIREAQKKDFASIRGVVCQRPTVRYVKSFQIVNALIRDEEGGSMNLSWFNMPYLAKTLLPGSQYVFRGRFKGYGKGRHLEQPSMYRPEEYEKLRTTLQPVYSLTKGITRKAVSDAVRAALSEGAVPEDGLPPELLRDYDLIPLDEALKEIHFPGSRDSLLVARKRLVFEEFYSFILNVRRMKAGIEAEPNSFVIQEREEVDRLVGALPYQLTGAQKRVLGEIQRDLQGPSVMNRLVQGDVGSGKTIVAFLAMYLCALNGYQSALMAPTEVLAKQHYENFRQFCGEYGLELSVELLTGSMTAKEKREAYERISTHSVDLVVGTHALIQGRVHYEDLALVITDEQHRFGVNQRKELSLKGCSPHVLVMSATPIPRTLGMILYGDMDISVMDELPGNRLPIKNAVVDIEYREKAWSFIRKQAEAGHQAYVICPMVEESENSEGENVIEYAEILRKEMPGVTVEYLHGRMSGEEKEAIMASFGRNEIQVLVSTTVIEVGIDVPNATVMLIENAERFGLAQLHQLRGRVGRGKDQSYCIFVDSTDTEDSKKRLEVLKNSNDGFFIASEDLKLRGPGDFFGLRQSGDLSFRLGDIYTDAAILQKAEEAAEKTFEEENRIKMKKAIL